jgi:hypothetical protein
MMTFRPLNEFVSISRVCRAWRPMLTRGKARCEEFPLCLWHLNDLFLSSARRHIASLTIVDPQHHLLARAEFLRLMRGLPHLQSIKCTITCPDAIPTAAAGLTPSVALRTLDVRLVVPKPTDGPDPDSATQWLQAGCGFDDLIRVAPAAQTLRISFVTHLGCFVKGCNRS